MKFLYLALMAAARGRRLVKQLAIINLRRVREEAIILCEA